MDLQLFNTITIGFLVVWNVVKAFHFKDLKTFAETHGHGDYAKHNHEHKFDYVSHEQHRNDLKCLELAIERDRLDRENKKGC